jgi:hypothetical protein
MGFLISRKELTAYNITGGQFTKGHWVKGTPNQFTFKASVQPMIGRELEMLPEGRRHTQSYFLFTDNLLQTVEGQNPDIVVIDNEQHEVFQRQNWQNQIIGHYRYIVIKLDKEKQIVIP